MKKITFTLLALVCAFCCAVGLAACGDDTVEVNRVTLDNTTLTLIIGDTETLMPTVTPDNATKKSVTWKSSAPSVASVDENGEVTALTEGTAIITATAGGKKAQCTVSVKMTEQDWQASLNALSVKNYSLTLSVSGSVVGRVKVDGDTYYDNGGEERIFVKDGENYYKYDKASADAKWIKTVTTETEYNDIVNVKACNLVTAATQAIAGGYSPFYYSDGKYVCDTLPVADGFVLKDIEVTIASGALKKIVCTQVGSGATPDRQIVIDDIGTIEIDLPTLLPTEGLEYIVNSNGTEAYVNSIGSAIDSDIVIASEYQGVPVTSIGYRAFVKSEITSVVIPDTVTYIGSNAFDDCASLTSVIIPDSVTQIDSYAFMKCTSLTSVIIPESVTTLGNRAFLDCSALTTVVIKARIERIYDATFSNCTSLTDITIPDSVTGLNSEVFNNCTSLANIYFKGTMLQWNSISKKAWWNKNIGDYTVHCEDGELER